VARSRRITAGSQDAVEALLAAAEAGNMRECWEQVLVLAPDYQGPSADRVEMPPEEAP